MLRTVCDRPTLWESLLPAEALVMPAELAMVDRLLDDARFFVPFRRWFDPVVGRPSISIETYLRLMFLKYRYRLGYETLCSEVSDSLTWLRFCRIPLGERAPHPTTLMKITSRCGAGLVEALNAELLAVAVEAGVVDVGWLRADTTVVPADIKYPTDSGLLVTGITRIAALVRRLQGAGVAEGALVLDFTAAARREAHRIGSKLRRRSEDAKAEVLAITGELAEMAEVTVNQARRVLAAAKATEGRPLRRFWALVADLEALLGAVGDVIAQTRLRLAGQTPAAATRRVCLCDGDARPIRKASLAQPTQFGYTAQVTDNRDGIIIDFELEAGMPADAPRLKPAIERAIRLVGAVPDAVTADRGYGQASVDAELGDLDVLLVAIPRKGTTSQKRREVESSPAFVEMVKWRTGSEGRIATLKRQYGWGRARLRGLTRVRTWCGWGVLCHNASKIANLTH